ncbi:hypothetical protein ARMSODRAFT_978664 [Armillaria solidipes]|uniref:Uncharacterized protein n=1 Tax=Armillaria solidipes TaxID=1076256 RepID=A0A2H3BK88_9AGAR|nr:hypothetical protein ARMSODRAFT_978664 [Armillaria solidipes]
MLPLLLLPLFTCGLVAPGFWGLWLEVLGGPCLPSSESEVEDEGVREDALKTWTGSQRYGASSTMRKKIDGDVGIVYWKSGRNSQEARTTDEQAPYHRILEMGNIFGKLSNFVLFIRLKSETCTDRKTLLPLVVAVRKGSMVDLKGKYVLSYSIGTVPWVIRVKLQWVQNVEVDQEKW